MRIGSLFSGIGGLELGLEMSGLGTVVWQCEINPFCRMVLQKYWPHVLRHDDIKTFTNPPAVDLICGGFPCQDISSAGKGAGLTGSRSGLWLEFSRIVEAIQPQWVIVENVSSGAKRWVDQTQAHLEQLGYETLPVPLSAQGVGAHHIRRRIFVIAHAIGDPIRDWAKRLPSRSQDGVQGQRQTEPLDDGTVGSTRKLSVAPSSWAVVPFIRRVADGFPYWLDRNRALGNSVVPQCAEVIGYMIQLMEEVILEQEREGMPEQTTGEQIFHEVKSLEQAQKYMETLVQNVERARQQLDDIHRFGQTHDGVPRNAVERAYRNLCIRYGHALGSLVTLMHCRVLTDEAYQHLRERVDIAMLPKTVGLADV
jgi:DNA (cytosine-5)-methyltransferase 1